MFNATSRGRHSAPTRITRCLRAVMRPVTLVPLPLAGAHLADAVPSMELSAGHMAQRPQVRMLEPGEGRIVSSLSTPDAPTLVMPTIAYPADGDLHLQVAEGRASLCGAEVPQMFRTTMYDFADCADCRAVADRMKAEGERTQVVIHSQTSQYNGRLGHAVERDEEGGYEVEILGVDHLLHFEVSEVEFTAEAAR